MARDNKTIYQQLNQLFNFDGFGFENPFEDQKTKFEKEKTIIKGKSPEEIHRKGLELQQKQQLLNKFNRATDRGFQKALQYEAGRLQAYIDYEGMEFYPLISSALDLYMEEATTIGLNGRMLNVFSNKERIKTLLDELFSDIININVNLPFWTRNLIKYGDNFTLLYGERKKGVSHVKQLVNYDIERFERVVDGKPKVIFKERNSGDEFNTFEIAHFRLLGDDKFIPYGSSLLNKVRRVYRQCLDGKSKIWTPNGYTNIEDINIDDDIYSFDFTNQNIIKTKVKNKSNNGIRERYEIITRHRNIIVTDDHLLLTFNGNDYEYKDLKNINTKTDKLVLPPTNIAETNNKKITLNDYNYYVKLNNTGRIKIENIESKGIMDKIDSLDLTTTRKNTHSFLKGYDRKIKYIDFIKLSDEFNLTLNDIDLYPFNSKHCAIANKNLEYTLNKDFIRFFGFMLGDGWIRSNVEVGFALGIYENENKFYIDLIEKLSNSKARIYRKNNTKSAKAIVGNKEFVEILKKFEFHTGFANKIIPDWVFGLSFELKLEFIKGIFDADGCDSRNVYSSSNETLITQLKTLAQTCNIQVGKIIKDTSRSGFIFDKSFNKIINRKPTYSLYMNIASAKNEILHQNITKINYVGNDIVWDIEVDNELHNFVADGLVVHNCVMAEDAMLTYRLIRAGEKKVFKIDVGNIDDDDIEDYIYKVATKFKKTSQIHPHDGQIDYRFNILGNDEDYFLPVRNANTQTGIDTLPGASNLSDIADIEYLRDNLFMGLGIPKPFLSFQDAAGGGKNLAQFDIRFAKKVNRIQQAMVQELNKMAIIHLYLLGYRGDDLTDFTLSLNNPSTQEELLKSELLRDKAQTYNELTSANNGIAAMSHTSAKRIIFNMSDKEIVDDLKQQKMERTVTQELQDSPIVIKKSGLFSDIDNKFGDESEMGGGEIPPENNETGMSPEGGGGGFSPTEIGGNELGGMGSAPEGGMGGTPESGNLPPLAETKRKMTENEYMLHVERLVYGDKKKNEDSEKRKVITETNNKNNILKNSANNFINEIDKMLENSKTIELDIDEDEEIDLDDLDIQND